MKATPMLAAAGAATLMLAAAAVRMIAASDASFAGFPCPLDPALTCVMSGLDSPRGLAFGPEGALYVAEAGRGGANLENPEDGFCCFTGPFGGMLSYGRTGAISRFWDGHQEQIATGLPSIAMPNGNRGTGPNDISFLGRGDAYVTIGLENDPAFRDTLAAQHPEFPELARFGHLVHVAASGEWRFGADIAAYEALHNPDGRLRDDGTPFFDSNPYGILAEPGGHVVTDAGGNSLLRVDSSGLISLLAVFHSRGSDPARPSFAPEPFDQFTDAVPTSVVVGPDGAYYVGELTGVPFVDASANIYRVVPGDAPRLFLIGDACDQYREGTRTDLVLGLTRPTSLVVGPDGALYISIRGLSPGAGEVIRVEP
jgi:hypothetical protein